MNKKETKKNNTREGFIFTQEEWGDLYEHWERIFLERGDLDTCDSAESRALRIVELVGPPLQWTQDEFVKRIVSQGRKRFQEFIHGGDQEEGTGAELGSAT